jgi:trimethylamine:corrinoid methyltransferase-like protein
VTLAGAVVQHAADCISGITIHQLAAAGAPIVWGAAPAIFDMRTGKTPMGAIETAMLDVACAEVRKSLGLPTHAYMVAGDGRLIDAQVEMESGMSAVLGALAGINMISGAGMLDFLACQSVEKLVIDAEAIASAQRLIEAIQPRTASLAEAMFAETGLQGDFLKLKETRALSAKSSTSLPQLSIAAWLQWIERRQTSSSARISGLKNSCRTTSAFRCHRSAKKNCSPSQNAKGKSTVWTGFLEFSVRNTHESKA